MRMPIRQSMKIHVLIAFEEHHISTYWRRVRCREHRGVGHALYRIRDVIPREVL